MKARNILLNLIPVLILSSCGADEAAKTAQSLSAARDSISALKADIDTLKTTVARLSDENRKLSYSAPDRLKQINALVSEGNYIKARLEIEDLVSTFPKSVEADMCKDITENIEKAEAARKAEEDRIKALGFKALKAETSFTVDYNKISISGITTGTKFIFDSYDDSWHYLEADRDNRYITAAMSVTSAEKDPMLPELAVYAITGDRMTLKGTFMTRYARWRDYGAYLGNYSDSQNDFSKVSTVRFKLGCEVPADMLSRPYAIVAMRRNVLSEHYERFNNPPQSWTGSAAYPPVLALDNFTSGQYIIVRLANI